MANYFCVNIHNLLKQERKLESTKPNKSVKFLGCETNTVSMFCRLAQRKREREQRANNLTEQNMQVETHQRKRQTKCVGSKM